MNQLFESIVSPWQVDLEDATAVHPSGLIVQFRPLGTGMGGYVGIPLNLEQVALSLADAVEDEDELHETLEQMLNEASEAYRHQLSRRH